MATDRPQVVGGGVLADRRVDAHRQRDDQADEDGQQPELGGDRQSSQHPLLDPPAAQQRLAEGAAQENATDPAAVLHVDRQVQAEPLFDGRAVDLAAHECRATGHDVDDVAGDEADGQEHQHAQDEQGRDDQQQPADDVGSHILRGTWAPGSTRLPAPCAANRTSAKTRDPAARRGPGSWSRAATPVSIAQG